MNPVLASVLRSALAGALGAAVTDIRAWKSWGDVEFNWKTASFRWFQGAFFGAVLGGGMNVSGL